MRRIDTDMGIPDDAFAWNDAAIVQEESENGSGLPTGSRDRKIPAIIGLSSCFFLEPDQSGAAANLPW